ncbi:hypothetical protein MKW98_012580 [Papaver atlanticum]|uniref:Phytocyanin domain-containing protein n=1 Tax=Papaver atlanticum TaxID=357466 RepID=A0AAD4T070_9MAGN|nr:hypothetical protein MKW98_012580 [Papaver atlanticum]
MTGLVIIIMATVLLMIQCDATLHTVGGTRNNGWRPNFMNYTSDWASHEEFYVGDWLYWGFSLPKINRDLYSVYEVNKTDYESCGSSRHVIAKVSRGAGRDVWELKEPRPYYFISGGGYCRQGMKLAVFVKELPPPPPPAPAKAAWKSGAPKLLNFISSLFTTVAAAAALAVLKLGVHD